MNLEIPEGQWIRPEESSFEGCAKLESLPLSKVSRNVVKGCSSLRTLNLKTSKIDTKEKNMDIGWRMLLDGLKAVRACRISMARRSLLVRK